jgi:small basic protein
VNTPTFLLVVGLVLMVVGEVLGIVRHKTGPDTITDYVKAVTLSKTGWVAVPGAILVGGTLIWTLLHFFGVA